MRAASDLVAYLNGYFAPEIWQPAGDLLGNVSISETDEFVRTLPMINGLASSRFDFARAPGITLGANDTINIRIPSAAQHRLVTEIAVSDPLPNAHLVVDFTIDLVAGAAAPNPNINVAVDFHWGSTFSDIALALLAPPVAIAKAVIEDAFADPALAVAIRGKLQDRLSAINTYRFDRSRDLAWPAGAPHITGVFSNDYAGGTDPQLRGYCDILLVADGYAAANIADFDQLAIAVRDHFSGASCEQPFRDFQTSIRLWKMSLVAGVPADTRERVIVPVKTPDRNTMNFANLARAAEIGLTARDFFGHDPIVVFASSISVLDRQNAGMRPRDDIRENSQGPYVLLELGDIGNAVGTLVHELGHTPLGHYLADEYAFGGSRVYRGLEPRPRNVSVNPIVGWAKWAPWSGALPQFFLQDASRGGAYEFDQQMFRFADHCRMRDSSGGDFCSVCAEELALGLLDRGHQMAGAGGHLGMVDLLVEYLSPWTEAQPRRVHVAGGGAAQLDAFDGGAGDTTITRVRLTLAGTSVPQIWNIVWNASGANGIGTYAQLTGTVVELDVVIGSTVDLTVTHDLASGILARNRAAPTTTARLTFSVGRAVAATALLPPTKLTQSVALGALIQPTIDAANGTVSLPQDLWIEARIGGMVGFRLATAIHFRITGRGNNALDYLSNLGQQGEVRPWHIGRVPPPDDYVWSAQTVWRALASNSADAPRDNNGICFRIGALPFVKEPRPPADPFDLVLDESATLPARPTGLRASSWHPNDRAIKFQFELKLRDDAWTGQNLLETSFLKRDQSNFDSVAITGAVPLNVTPGPTGSDFYKWRVRAVDDQTRMSNWVEGRVFAVYWIAQRPTSLKNLVDVLKTLDGRVLQRHGPNDIPRVFMSAQWQPPAQDTDFSKLKDWRMPPR